MTGPVSPRRNAPRPRRTVAVLVAATVIAAPVAVAVAGPAAAAVRTALAAAAGLDVTPTEIAVAKETGDTLTITTVEVPAYEVEDTVNDLRATGADAAVNGRVRMLADPGVKDQWGYARLGGQTLLDSGATGAGVTVAVLDSGVDSAHPDLAGQILSGYDIIHGRPMPTPYDDNGHGTHVAGIIAAVAGNGIGIAGVAPGVKILPVKVLDDTGYGDDAGVGRGLVWAVDNGADVVNMSLGTYDNNPVMAAAVEYATSKGVVVVASSGNDRAGGPASYPAAYPQAFAVAATTAGDQRAYYSTTGSYVDVAAPGDFIYSTLPDGGYMSMSGTSMAAPHVAAAVAVVAQKRGVSAVRAADLLKQTAIDLGTSGQDNEFGAGLISVTEASGVGGQVPPVSDPGTGLPGLPSLPGLPDLPTPSLAPLPMPSLPQTPVTGPTAPALPALPSMSPRPMPSLPPVKQPAAPKLPGTSLPSPKPTTPSTPNVPADPQAEPPATPAAQPPDISQAPDRRPSSPSTPATPSRLAVAATVARTGGAYVVRVQAAGTGAAGTRAEVWTATGTPRRLGAATLDSRGRATISVTVSRRTAAVVRVGASRSNTVRLTPGAPAGR